MLFKNTKVCNALNVATPIIPTLLDCNVKSKDTMRWSWYVHFCFRYSMRLETFRWSSTTILRTHTKACFLDGELDSDLFQTVQNFSLCNMGKMITIYFCIIGQYLY